MGQLGTSRRKEQETNLKVWQEPLSVEGHQRLDGKSPEAEKGILPKDKLDEELTFKSGWGKPVLNSIGQVISTWVPEHI